MSQRDNERLGAILASSCAVCGVGLAGPLGAALRIVGIRRSAQNPNLCNRCGAHIEDGRVVELAVFFADLTGYTSLTHSQGPERTHQVLDLYLRTATEVIVKWDGFVSQFVGDEVMAFFNVPLARDDFGARAVAAATELQNRMPALSDAAGLPVRTTIGIAAGYARVGLVGAEPIRHYSAIGDVVNRAARLVARVEPGGILVDDSIYAAVAGDFPDAEREQLLLKGFDEPVGALRLRGASRLAPTARGTAPPRRPVRLLTALSALLGAPCAGGIALHAMGVAVASASFGLATALPFLEQDFVRFPLMAMASLGALANLAVVRAGRAEARATAAGSRIAPTRSERRRTAAGVALSVVALGLVGFEIVVHKLLHG